MKVTKEMLKRIIKEELQSVLQESPKNPLFIFDFDDTLAKTDSRMKIKRGDETLEFDSREFAKYRPQQGDIPDYSGFSRAEGTTIDETIKTLINTLNMFGEDNVFIVTARALAKPISQFLYDKGIRAPEVVATAGSTGKSTWLKNKLETGKYDEVVVYEDSSENLDMLEQIVNQYNVQFNKQISYMPILIDTNDKQQYYK